MHKKLCFLAIMIQISILCTCISIVIDKVLGFVVVLISIAMSILISMKDDYYV